MVFACRLRCIERSAMHVQVIQSETTYKGRAFAVRRDRVRFPGGRLLDLDIVDHVPSVTIVPVDEDGNVVFVRQYRHAVGDMLLELPAGTVQADEDRQTCAVRECREEIGMSPGSMTLLGECFLAPGYTTEFMGFYLARDLVPAPLPPDEDEVLKVERLPLTEAVSLATSGGLRDAKSIVGLCLTARHLGLEVEG
jgi:ADP-ribose pyrophosphatase